MILIDHKLPLINDKVFKNQPQYHVFKAHESLDTQEFSAYKYLPIPIFELQYNATV